MPKFNFELMENNQHVRFAAFAKMLEQRSHKESAQINGEIGIAKEEIVKSAVTMDKALSSGKRKFSRKYLDKALQRLNFLETESSGKAVRRTLHKMGYRSAI